MKWSSDTVRSEYDNASDHGQCLRIVHLIDSLDCGGAEQIVANLAATQSRNGHNVLLVCLRGLGPRPVDVKALNEVGVRIVTLKKPAGFHFATLRKLTTLLRVNSADIVHTHNHLVHHYGAFAGRLALTPAIVNTLHGTSNLCMPFPAKVLYWLSCLIGNSVVSVCAQVHDVFSSAYMLRAKSHCMIDNGIDLTRFVTLRRRAPGEHFTFGMIARFDAVKHHENLIRAFGHLKASYPNVRLKLLGEGDLKADMESLANGLGVSDSISFEGFSLDTPGFLGDIDAYVISSRSEGLPLTLLEAMGAALPIVSTAVGGIPSIVTNGICGWLCAPENHEELATAMKSALLSRDLSEIGNRNRAIAIKHYSIDRMAREYEDHYLSVLQRSR